MDFSSVLESARNGSTPALGTILESCRSYITLIATRRIPRRLQGRIRASSLVEETYLRACKDFRNRFDGRTEWQMLAWLRTILIHHLIDQLRRPEFRFDHTPLPLDLAGPLDLPVDQVADQECATALLQALSRLKPRERLAIELHHFDRLGFKEIGGILGCSDEAARKVWGRAQAKLGGELERFR